MDGSSEVVVALSRSSGKERMTRKAEGRVSGLVALGRKSSVDGTLKRSVIPGPRGVFHGGREGLGMRSGTPRL